MQEERYGSRDRAYSAWHRHHSIRRYVGIEAAQTLSMCDLDMALYCEYDDSSREPLCLVETARDIGQVHKPCSVTQSLARRARLPAYVVLYRCALEPNPADVEAADIESFRVKRIWPAPESEWRSLDPQEWADALVRIRTWQARHIDRESALPVPRIEPYKRLAAKRVNRPLPGPSK